MTSCHNMPKYVFSQTCLPGENGWNKNCGPRISAEQLHVKRAAYIILEKWQVLPSGMFCSSLETPRMFYTSFSIPLHSLLYKLYKRHLCLVQGQIFARCGKYIFGFWRLEHDSFYYLNGMQFVLWYLFRRWMVYFQKFYCRMDLVQRICFEITCQTN